MIKDSFASSIPEIERAIGYTFRDKGLIRQAFTRSSWCNEHPSGGYQSNEVLEFFGDGVLSVAIISLLLSSSTERCGYGIRTELGEGDFSNIKSKLSDKTNLSASMAKLGLQKHLLVGEGDARLGIASEPSVMEDLFESIVGAVYIDSEKNMDMVTKVVINMLDMSVYADSSAVSVSPKNALQEWCADKKRRLPPPIYRTISESGPDHKKEYCRGVYVGERLVASAKGKNQKTADALAAKEALRILSNEDGAAAARQPAAKQKSEQTKQKPEQPAAKQKPEQAKQKPEQPAAKQKPEQAKPAAKQKPEQTKPAAVSAPAPAPVRKKHSAIGPSSGATALLRTHALKTSSPPPVFRDLGLIAKDEHSVECSFMGQRAIATAPTRSEARERAAQIIREALRLK